MTAVPEFATSVLAEIIRRQPLSPGKVMLAWQVAAGPQLARASQAEIEANEHGSLTLAIRARDGRWAGEIERLRPMLTERLARLLAHAVTLRIS